MADEVTGSELATIGIDEFPVEDLFQCFIRSPRQTFVECDENNLKKKWKYSQSRLMLLPVNVITFHCPIY
jgi:hypothetical protein